MTAPALKLSTKADPVQVLLARAEARAYLWSEGEYDLHEAVDALQAAAVQTGLVAKLGQDAVQAIVAKAFATWPAPVPAEVVPDLLPETTPGIIHAAASTVEALMFSLRERGASALTEKSCQRRLAGLSTVQVRNVIERLFAARPRFRAIDDELLFQLGKQQA